MPEGTDSGKNAPGIAQPGEAYPGILDVVSGVHAVSMKSSVGHGLDQGTVILSTEALTKSCGCLGSQS